MNEIDEAAARIEHWISEHPSRAYAARFPVDDTLALVAEVRRLRDENEQLSDLDAASSRRSELQAERDRAVTRWHEEHKRAETAEAERDRQWQLKEIALGELTSVRLLAEQIKRCADWPGIEDTATYPEIVESLRVCAAGLVRALTPHLPPGGPHSHASGSADGSAANETQPSPEGSTDALAASELDWTIDPETGRSNSSQEFLHLTAEVGHLIRSGGSSQCLSPRWTAATARTIMAQLAHVHGLAPSGTDHAPQQPATGYRAIRREQHPEGGEPAVRPICPDCDMPETNCACE